MAYVIVFVMPKGGKYWVQDFRGKELRLNGLRDNAKVYAHEWQAREDIPRCKIHLGIKEKGVLHIEEILPKS